MKRKSLKKLSLNKNVITSFQQKRVQGGGGDTSIGGCHSYLGTCGPPESAAAYPAPCPFG